MAKARTGEKLPKPERNEGGRPRVLGDQIQNVEVRMPEALYKRLKVNADTTGMSMNEIIRRAVEKWLDE